MERFSLFVGTLMQPINTTVAGLDRNQPSESGRRIFSTKRSRCVSRFRPLLATHRNRGGYRAVNNISTQPKLRHPREAQIVKMTPDLRLPIWNSVRSQQKQQELQPRGK
ncbi:hypothetical protein SBA4_360043 [Candidatus Sulfopaludibacter sp. SbA4]|nr:hypothetical protein SBA4_360043 [Candidatus Sulfopaludibacter sp. SbA4]